MDKNFWAGKKVFVTGHTGFKGSWLCLWLQECGAHLCGYSLDPNTDPSLFIAARVADGMKSVIGDVRNLNTLRDAVDEFQPEIFIHLAAQALVRLSYEQPVETYSTNVMGTVNVLEAIRKCSSVKSFVNVTSDKCYENKEWEWGYRENEPMGGHDPYSNSKGCSELVTGAYRDSYFSQPGSVAVASARAGNVIGGGDWAKDRLIPDILESFEKLAPVLIRNPSATRPWQHVLEPISGYLCLAEKLYLTGHDYVGAWNFGPRDQDVKSVQEVVEQLSSIWGDGAEWSNDSSIQPHEAQLLKLDISKAVGQLDWTPRWNLDDTLRSIVSWHKEWLGEGDMRAFTLKQINEYELS